MKRIVLSLIAILGLSIGLFAQLWVVQNSGLAESRGITDMFSVNSNVVWAAAYDGTAPTNPCVDVTMTTNGGTTWTPKNIGATAVCIANLVAIDANKAWAIVYSPTGANTPNDGVYYTSDGGTTWTHQTTALFSNSVSFPDCVHFWDANNGWCMGDPISGEFEIYTTTNGGTTWTAVPGANIPNPVSGEFGIVGYYCAVGNTVWFGTNKGRVYKSIDQGHNWTVSTITGWTSIYTFPHMKDALVGFAMDEGDGGSNGTVGRIVKTIDGGATWTAQTPVGNCFSNDMDYVPGTPATWVTTGAASTLSGVSYSFDDCANFSDMVETIGTQFLAETWQNDSTGWAGGFVTSGVGGMNKFNNILVLKSDFETADTDIMQLDSAHFTNLSEGKLNTYAWTFQNGSPPTSNLKTPPPIQYILPGSWNVSLTVTGDLGSTTTTKSGYIHVGTIGINEHSKASISVYPNPVTDVMNIIATSNMQEIQVLNLLGEVLLNQTINTKSFSMNTSDLKAGFYNLKIKMSDGYINKKIVKN
jgi:photosystem II stability/assembly factor-like uncharacterized protein